jgi:dTDP-glucose 4,6-dehydratase
MTAGARHVIIGGSGFVGQHLAAALRRRGQDTLTFDVLRPSGDEPRRAGFIEGDVRRRADLERLALRGGDIVYHLAARVYHGGAPRRGRDEWFADVNVGGTACLLETMSRAGADALVFFSTDMVYGRAGRSPVLPDQALNPLGPYGRSKVGAEQLIDKARANGLRATVFRPRLITGAGRFGILMKLFRLMRLGLPVPLIGDGRNRYQMVSVGDCVAAALLAVQRGLPAGPFHLGSDDPPTVRELLRSMIERIGSRSMLVPTPAVAVQRALAGLDKLGLPLLYPEQFMIADLDCVLDTTRSTEALGWVPHDSDLDMMLDAYAHAVSARLLAPA